MENDYRNLRSVIISLALLACAIVAYGQTSAELLGMARRSLEHDSIDRSKSYYLLYHDRTGDHDSELEYLYAEQAYADSTYFLAVHWYDQAVKHGHGAAAAALSRIYRQGLDGIPQDTVAANAYHRQAVKLGADVPPLPTRSTRTVTRPQQPKATAEPKPEAKPVDQPVPQSDTTPDTQSDTVYDEIRAGQSLASMAKKHYGYSDFWVYIYLENQAKIKSPNNVALGTRLAIAPLSKYATAPTLDENLQQARIRASQVLRQSR